MTILELSSTMSMRTLAALAASFMLAAACDDPMRPPATGTNNEITGSAYPLNSAPAGAPSALSVYRSVVGRPTPTFAFDLAFDLDAQRRVLLIPARLVVGGLTEAPRVGLQRSTTAFAALDRAPVGGYTLDSTLVVTPGTTVLVKLPQSQFCAGSIFGTDLYSKMSIDSVATDRRIWFRILTNTTCGFRSLTPGVPKD